MANLTDLLAAVDERAPDESSAFLIDGDGERGSVFVETGRVCWAATPGRSRRLRDLLRRHADRALDDHELDRAFADCRDAGLPLGELLIERGLVSDDGLRTALKQHTAIAWRSSRRLIHAAVIHDPMVLKCGVTALAQRGLPAVLSSRVPAVHL